MLHWNSLDQPWGPAGVEVSDDGLYEDYITELLRDADTDTMEARAGNDNLEESELPGDNLRGFALMISKLLFRLAQI